MNNSGKFVYITAIILLVSFIALLIYTIVDYNAFMHEQYSKPVAGLHRDKSSVVCIEKNGETVKVVYEICFYNNTEEDVCFEFGNLRFLDEELESWVENKKLSCISPENCGVTIPGNSEIVVPFVFTGRFIATGTIPNELTFPRFDALVMYRQ